MSGDVKNKQAIGWCEWCQKDMYTTRKKARRVSSNYPGHKAAYRCPHDANFWHNGGVPREVVRGEMTRDEFFKGPPS